METSSQATENYPTSWKLGVIIASLYFGSFLIALDTNIINVAIPKITTDFQSLGDVAWYGTAYLLTITAFQPIFGSFYKFFNTSAVYKISIIIFEVGSVLCAVAPSSIAFIIGRAIAGLGAAGILQGALSIISHIIPLEKRPLYMGIVISVFAVTVCAGPPLGGAFTQHVSWRWCFWINLPIGAIVLIALQIFLKIKEGQNHYQQLPLRRKFINMDPFGCLILISAVCCLLLALQWGGQTKAWKSPTIIGLLVGFAMLAALFICIQLRLQANALIPIHVFRHRSIWTGAMVLFFLGSSNYLMTFFLPFWFQSVRNITPIGSGVYFIPYLLPQIIALVIVGALVKVSGHYVPFMILGEMICIVGTSLLTQLSEATTTVKWASYLVVTGIGMGMAMQLPYTAVQVTLSDNDIPTGNGIAVLFYQLGGATAISFGQTITISTILEQLPGQIPHLHPELVLKAGAAGLSDSVASPAELSVLRTIWNTAIARTMILSVALVAASVPFTFGMEWLNVKKVTMAKKAERDEREKRNQAQGEEELMNKDENGRHKKTG